MRIVAFSDTHTHHRDISVPPGDVLIFAGDLMGSGYKPVEVQSFSDWFCQQPHKHKIVVAGNHDRLFESNQTWCLKQFTPDIVYLRDSDIVIDGVKFYGSPVQPWFCMWAFNVPRGPGIKEYWDRISESTDVLITHGPAYGILDKQVPEADPYYIAYQHLGCEELLKAVGRIKPKVHIFGHIHGSAGNVRIDGTDFHNVAICDEGYKPVNPPHVIDLKH